VAYILNYNSALHDIYTYSGELLLVSELPPNNNEVLANRRAQYPTGYNPTGLWRTSENIGLPAPDFSGITVSHRGSAIFYPGDAYRTYRGGIEAAQAAGPLYSDVFNLMNWNPGAPRYVLLSNNYLLGTLHFNVPVLGSVINPLLVGRDNVVRPVTARLVVNLQTQRAQYDLGADASDFALYRLDEPIPENARPYIQPCLIADPRTIPNGYPVWKSGPNGFFSVLSVERSADASILSSVSDGFRYYTGIFGDASYPVELSNNNSGIPAVWSGDSGSPILLVADNGQTMFLSLKDGGGSVSDRTFAFLQKYIYENSGEKIQRGNVVAGSNATGVKNKVEQYLDESVRSNPVFLPNPAASSYPPFVAAKLTGPMNKIKDAYLSNIRFYSETPRLLCDIMSASGELIGRDAFVSASETVIGGYVHGLAVVSEMSFSYVLPLNATFSGSDAIQYSLTPMCLESEQGSIQLTAGSPLDATTSADVNLLEGYNYDIVANSQDSELTFNVAIGAGAGLEPCPDATVLEPAIRLINRQQPDERGNFLIYPAPSDCLTVDHGSSTVKVNSHCAPCCRCRDYGDASDYIRGFAATYARLVQQYNDLVSKYNSVNEAFKQRIDAACCPTSDILNARYRIWPQQNFKLQIQALAENNSSNYIRMKDMTLNVKLALSQAEAVTDPTTGITYSMNAGDPIASVPINEASYLYFKNINPGRYVQTSVVEEGTISSSVNFETLPLSTVCSEGDSPTDIPPCTGYAMVTAAMVLVDPTFRRIVNLKGQDVTVQTTLEFSYTGTLQNGSPCGPIDNRPISTVVKSVKIGPNKSSVNPCPPASPSGLSINDQGRLILSFSDVIQVLPGAFVTRSLKLLDPDTGEYVDGGSIDIPVSTAGSQLDLGPVDASQSSYVVTVSFADLGGLLYTQCSALDTPDNVVNLPVPPFSISVSQV